MKIIDVVKSMRRHAEPMSAILHMKNGDSVIVYVLFSDVQKCLCVSHYNKYTKKETIKVPYQQEIDVHVDGGFEITKDDGEKCTLVIMMPMLNTTVKFSQLESISGEWLTMDGYFNRKQGEFRNKLQEIIGDVKKLTATDLSEILLTLPNNFPGINNLYQLQIELDAQNLSNKTPA
jgi:hypothetical protein